MQIIKREKYIDEISKFENSEIIKVIVGQRRVGKSYFTKQLINYISENQPKKILFTSI